LSVLDYYMTRHSTELMLTFELVADVLVGGLVIYLYRARVDRNSVWVYFLIGGLHAILEVYLALAGVRRIEHPAIAGIPIGFPLPAIITGIFEGGLIGLAAYHFVRAVVNGDLLSRRIFVWFCVVFGTLTTISSLMIRIQLRSHPDALTLTRRALFTWGGAGLLPAFFLVAATYFLLNRRLSAVARYTALYYYAGVVIFLAVMIVPLHAFGIRFIERGEAHGYARASALEQLVIMYLFNILLEAGWFVCDYVLICAFGLIEFDGAPRRQMRVGPAPA
jgi:hypothetical protein